MLCFWECNQFRLVVVYTGLLDDWGDGGITQAGINNGVGADIAFDEYQPAEVDKPEIFVFCGVGDGGAKSAEVEAAMTPAGEGQTPGSWGDTANFIFCGSSAEASMSSRTFTARIGRC
eukprot:scaffold101627_cov70-Cyclotella_meneghiniana.AAC.3